MKSLLLLPILLLTLNSTAQDPSFSLPNENLTYINPAFTGTAENFRVGGSYRNQWPNLSGNYITTNLHADQHLGKFGGVGLTYIHDLAGGTFKTDNIYLDYAYKVNLGENGVLSFGLEAGVIQKTIDWEKVTFGTNINPNTGFVYSTSPVNYKSSVMNFDVGSGVLYYNKHIFGGYAAHHLNQPNVSLIEGGESRLPILHNVYLGGKFNIGNVSIIPQLDLKRQGDFQNYTSWLMAKYKFASLGVGYRDKDSFLYMLGLNFEKFRINYAYDFTVSKLSVATGGSHEIAFQLLLKTLKKPNDRPFDM